MREEFEAWWREFFCGLEGSPDWNAERNCYVDYGTHLAWKAYQAGRQAGALAMRERAAKESLAFGGNPSVFRAIRALPVEQP